MQQTVNMTRINKCPILNWISSKCPRLLLKLKLVDDVCALFC